MPLCSALAKMWWQEQGRAEGATGTHNTEMEMGENTGTGSFTHLQGEQRAITMKEPLKMYLTRGISVQESHNQV